MSANEALISKLKLLRARKAREGQEIVAWPSTEEFKAMLRRNEIKNTDFGPKDVDMADKLWGEAVPILKGKMKRKHPSKHVRFDYHSLPKEFYNKEIELYTDVITTLKCNHLMIKSGDGIDYVSGKYCKTQKLDVMTKHISDEIVMYEKRGFKVVGVHVDGPFDTEDFKKTIFPAKVHVYSPGEHVGIIEHSNKTVKERLRCIVHSLPYNQLPRIVIICMIQHVVYHLNHEKKQGKVLCPNEIITGGGSIDFSKKKIKFGGYAQVWGGTTNTMKERSLGCIAMHRLNDEGGYHFLSLNSGHIVKSNQWEDLPVTDDVIAQVENLAKRMVTKDSMLEYLNTNMKHYEIQEDFSERSNSNTSMQGNRTNAADVEPQEEFPHANPNQAQHGDFKFEEDNGEFRPHIIPVKEEEDIDQGEKDMNHDINLLDETDTVVEAENTNLIQQDLNAVPLDDYDYDGVDSDMEESMDIDE